jgi:hypothetical protein
MRKQPRALATIILVVVLLLYPFKVTVAPEWNVKVVDENGDPVPGAYVEEFASNGTLDFEHEESVCTKTNGEAQFAPQMIRASVLTRVTHWISKFSIHGGLGPHVVVGVDRLGYGDMPTDNPMPDFNGLTWNGSPSRLTSPVVLQKCPEGFTGYRCGAEYAYFFSINSDSRKIAACSAEISAASHKPD